MQWFRFYDEVVDDPKAQQLPPVLFKHWINLLCIANKERERGTLPCVRDIAFRLRLTEAKTRAILEELTALGLLDKVGVTLHPHNWDGRQRRSDNVTERVAKHRSNVTRNDTGNNDDAFPRARITETDTEQNRTETPKPPKYSADFETFWSAYPKGRGGKAEAFAFWHRLIPFDRQAAMDALPAFKAGRDWREGFHKAPDQFLKHRLWENPPEPATSNGRHALPGIERISREEEDRRRTAAGYPPIERTP